MRRSFLASLAFAAMLSMAHGARADDAAAAQQLFDDGKKLMAENKWSAACPKLEESLRLSPAAGTKFNLADCYEHVGRTASAWAQFLAAAAQTKAAGQRDREKAARDRAAALEPKLSRLAIVVPQTPQGLEVTRDGESVGRAQWGDALPIDPGEHLVVASAPGKRTWKTKVEVSGAGNSTKIIVPELEDAAPPAAGAPEPASAPLSAKAPAPDEAPKKGGSNATLGWVLVGAGGAAIVGGVVMWVLRGNEISKLESACGADQKSCPASAADDIANGKTYTALGVGLFGLGAVCAGAGAGVLIVGGGKDKTAAHVRVSPVGRGVGLAGTF